MDFFEGLPVQYVELQVEHRQPDPERRENLDQHQPPVRQQHLEPVEQEREGSHREGQRREDPAPFAEPEQALEDDFVFLLDGPDERANPRHEGGSTGSSFFADMERESTPRVQTARNYSHARCPPPMAQWRRM